MTPTTTGRRTIACLAVTATAVAGAALAGTPASASPLPFDDGHYVVLLDDAALASYAGGLPGLRATKPAEGEAVDLTGADARAYAGYLSDRQSELLEEVDAEATYTYQVTFNGFAAELDAQQATKLSGLPGVTAVLPDEKREVDTVRSPEFLGLPGAGGVWESVGGVDAAGEGVVVGVLDTGIWPENASFAGERLRTGSALRTDGKGRAVGRNPLVGTPFRTPSGEIHMLKGDRTVFRGACETGEGWDSADLCNDKLITARYFADGFLRAAPTPAQRSPHEFISPRDGDGHGSHTAGTAAGNHGVPMSIDGQDLGEGSGVAPAAKVAAYKVCWEGATAATTGCYTADSIRAIEQAVLDGVDVINYSISGATTTVVDGVELAFLGAANAGVVVAASAGNSGPGASTVAHNSPWVLTVGATTFKRDEGTVVLPDGRRFKGASVLQQTLPQTRVVLSTQAGAAGAAAEDVRLCVPGSLDPAVVTGAVVVCDRGVIARVDKSAAVKQAGGVGMVQTNTGAGESLDPDYHSVPSVHVDSTAGAAIKSYVASAGSAATVSLEPGDTTGGTPTPLPQVAGFSSRGPALSSDSDILKPDIAAPGVAVVAAVAPGPNGGNDYQALSGTSMSSPHVAGLAALVLGEHPQWHPSVVKSAIMTTATNIKAADGSEVTDPFVQGAGFVNPAAMFRPGLVLPATEAEWGRFYAGQGLQLGDPGKEYEPLAATDLNTPSIAISQLAGPRTVTRTFQALEAGTWRVSADVPGIEVTSSVPQVTGNRSGRKSTAVDLTFTRTDAPLAQWAKGFVTLEGPTTVRIPVAVRPVSVAAPAEVSASVADGSVTVDVTPGFTGDLEVDVRGLARGTSRSDSIAAATVRQYTFGVGQGTSLGRFEVLAANPEGDFDLVLARQNAAGGYVIVAQAATAAASERIDLRDLPAGNYLLQVANFANAPGETTGAFEAVWYLVDGTATAGDLTATPDPVPATAGQPTSFDVSWTGLDASARYLGWVGYDGAVSPTVLSIG